MTLKEGDIITFERIFTIEDVKLFTKVSGNHMNDGFTFENQGIIAIQDLLTATLPTKIGGDYNLMVRKMNFEFLGQVFIGDTILCEVIIEKREELDDSKNIVAATFCCTNQHHEKVLKGTFTGVL